MVWGDVQRCLDQWNVIRLLYIDTFVSEYSTLLWKLTLNSSFSAVAKGLLSHEFFSDLRYLYQRNLMRSFWGDPGFLFRARCRLLLFYRISICLLWCVGFQRFFHTAEDCLSRRVSTAFIEFQFSRMSEEVLLDGVNVMCKDVWTNETWLDCCILTLLLLLNIVLCSGC